MRSLLKYFFNRSKIRRTHDTSKSPNESIKIMFPLNKPLTTELRRISNNLSTSIERNSDESHFPTPRPRCYVPGDGIVAPSGSRGLHTRHRGVPQGPVRGSQRADGTHTADAGVQISPRRRGDGGRREGTDYIKPMAPTYQNIHAQLPVSSNSF